MTCASHISPALSQDPVLEDFLKRVAPVCAQIHRLILFGSRARGTAHFDSDYDLLVVVAKKDETLLDVLYEAVIDVLYEAVIDVLYEAVIDVLLAHGRLVSLKVYEEREFVRLQALGTPFMEHVAEEGIPLWIGPSTS